MNAKMTAKTAFLLVAALLPTVLFAQTVGRIQYTRGAVTMQNMDGSSARLVARNETVKQGEVVKTGPKSFTIIRLEDGTRMTVRPNSTFSVEQMNARKDSTASALLRLFRGGLRTITGYISKKNPRGYRLRTPVATIGIRGTEFDIRLCEDDCAEENSRIKEDYDKQLAATVARTVFVRGSVTAKAADGSKRTLKAGGAIREGDTLITGSNAYAILVFRDKSRISLQSDTVFRVDEMRFDAKSAEKSSSLFSLLRGGLRTVTGLIGKLHPKKYRMRTSIATIGIRGTGYDMVCTGPCEVADVTGLKPLHLKEGDGLHAYVWDGSISVGEQVLQTGQAAYQPARQTVPIVQPTVPAFFRNNKVPRPDKVKVDESQLFSKIETGKAEPGLYVSVAEGVVDLKSKAGNTVVLKKGQAGYTDVLGRQVSKLARAPAFQRFDSVPRPDTPNPAVINLNSTAIGADDTGTVCVIK